MSSWESPAFTRTSAWASACIALVLGIAARIYIARLHCTTTMRHWMTWACVTSDPPVWQRKTEARRRRRCQRQTVLSAHLAPGWLSWWTNLAESAWFWGTACSTASCHDAWLRWCSIRSPSLGRIDIATACPATTRASSTARHLSRYTRTRVSVRCRMGTGILTGLREKSSQEWQTSADWHNAVRNI